MPEVIVVLVKNGDAWVTAVVPGSVSVPPGNQSITWIASGPKNARFPEGAGRFWWKTSPPPPVGLPTRVDEGHKLVLSYDNQFMGIWLYGIQIENDEVGPISIDPEIDNGPPRP
ncbi:MAG: hypothetical protein ABI779_13605 [Acidobacteriota bacterium]